MQLALPYSRPVRDTLQRLARADLALLLLVAVVVLGAGLGLRDAWPADEPRFALIARDMVLSGQWLIPRVGGELYSDKPPLFMWLVAGLYAVTGELRLAFLLPSLLAGLGTLALVYDLARRLWNRRAARVAGLLLLVSMQFALQARSAQLDALLAFWTTLGLYGLLRHLLLGPDWRWYGIAGLAMGLGVITKGVGFLPLFVLLPWAWLRWRRPARLPVIHAPLRRWLLAPALMLVPIACWLGPVLSLAWLTGSPELVAYRDDLLFRQTLTRYADAWTHLRPAWYYLQVIPWAWLPGVLALPWLVPAWSRRLARGDARTWLLLGYVVSVVLFFSLSAGKRGVYLLPALPALVLASAPLLAAGILRRPAVRAAALVLLAGMTFAALATAGALVLDVAGIAERAAVLGLPARGLAGLAAVLGVVAAGFTAWGLQARREVIALVGVLALSWPVQGLVGYPLLNEARSATGLMAEVRTTMDPIAPLALAGWKEQFLLHAGRPVVHFGYRRVPAAELRDVAAWLAGEPRGRVLIAATQLRPCLDPLRTTPVATRHGKRWVLAGADALTGACDAAPVEQGPRLYDPARGDLVR